MSIKKDILLRVGLVYIAIAMFSVFIVIKIVYLQFIDDDQWKKKAENTRVQKFRIPSHRGDIYAADMRLLASSVPYYEVRMDLNTPALTDEVFFGKVDSLAWCLSRLFGDRTEAEYRNGLMKARAQGNRYYLIKKRVDYLELKQLREFPIFRRGQFKGGLIVVQENIRPKPHGNLASRTIGYTTRGQSGNIVGIEGAYDAYLRGVEGEKRMQKLSGGVWMPLDGAGSIEPRDGSSVVTTLDVDLQDLAEKALLKQLIEHEAHAGCAVLMEVKTGEVKAIVNLTDTFGAYREYYNYAVGLSSEPGSTFKLPAILAAIEDGHIDLNDTVHTGNGVFQYYDHKVRDDNYLEGGHGTLTVEEVFEYSSNVGMAKIITNAYRDKPHRFVDRLYSMNLNEPLGVEIYGEGEPVIRYPGHDLWSGVSLATMSYGYEVKMTPLQILTFYNAIANDGKMVKPHFAKEIRYHGKLERTFQTEVINPSICSRSTLKKVRTMLNGVVEEGTAKNLHANGFKIAGKTGTTQMYNPRTGYREKSYQASFVGYFPADDPVYSCIVVVYDPKRYVYHGSHVAGPVFLELAKKVYATNLDIQEPMNTSEPENIEIPFSKNGYTAQTYQVLQQLNIKALCEDPASEWISTKKEDDHIELFPREITMNLVPNVVSMGLKDAVYLLENMGLKVEVRGRGSVRNQSIPPGTRYRAGDRIRLEMTFTDG